MCLCHAQFEVLGNPSMHLWCSHCFPVHSSSLVPCVGSTLHAEWGWAETEACNAGAHLCQVASFRGRSWRSRSPLSRAADLPRLTLDAAHSWCTSRLAGAGQASILGQYQCMKVKYIYIYIYIVYIVTVRLVVLS